MFMVTLDMYGQRIRITAKWWDDDQERERDYWGKPYLDSWNRKIQSFLSTLTYSEFIHNSASGTGPWFPEGAHHGLFADESTFPECLEWDTIMDLHLEPVSHSSFAWMNLACSRQWSWQNQARCRTLEDPTFAAETVGFHSLQIYCCSFFGLFL